MEPTYLKRLLFTVVAMKIFLWRFRFPGRDFHGQTCFLEFCRISFINLGSCIPSGVNHWGTGRDCPLQSFDWGAEVLTPPKSRLRRDSAVSSLE